MFGKPFDRDWYISVISKCALLRDLENFSGGDLTEIGEKGINLSGGQKQRIALARACYSKAEFVLLDDPFSAVDAPTSYLLLHNVILDLLKGRTCVLVTNAVHLVLPYADNCMLLKNGQLVCHGAPFEISKSADFRSIYTVFELARKEECSSFEYEPVKLSNIVTKMISKESKVVGSISYDIYLMYFWSSGGIVFLLGIIVLTVLCGILRLVNDWWLKIWSDSNLMSKLNFLRIESLSNFLKLEHIVTMETNRGISYLAIYAGIGLFTIVLQNILQFVLLWGSYRTSKIMHSAMLDAILNAPLRFFECTPLGRIINRFSKDVEIIDTQLSISIQNFLERLIVGVILIVILISAIVPLFLIPAVPVFIVYCYLAFRFITPCRDLKRLESISKTPVFSKFAESLNGNVTIRAYGQQQRFMVRLYEALDLNQTIFLSLWAINRWLYFRASMISGILTFLAGVLLVYSKTDSGWAAIALSYSLSFTQGLLYALRMHAEVELGMNAVERIVEYQNIEGEEQTIAVVPLDWPQNGIVNVNNLSTRYSKDSPNVLHQISFTLNKFEKLGVVGRTGAGKSSLSLAFFRIILISEGYIEIDGVDVTTVSLHDLRSRLSIIPQDPVLFGGTVRSNLDPLEEHTDEKLWAVLKRVHFFDSMQSSVDLDHQVTENGTNFSQGQRQLLCLARALLRQAKLVFMDEATASIDGPTDLRIQETIKTELKNSTVVCIAHRIKTVIDYDKIIVLEQGRVKEMGTPLELITNTNGAFQRMCVESGEYQELLKMAIQTSKV